MSSKFITHHFSNNYLLFFSKLTDLAVQTGEIRDSFIRGAVLGIEVEEKDFANLIDPS